MTELIPLLVVYDPSLKVGFALLVLFENLCSLLYRFFAYVLLLGSDALYATVSANTLPTEHLFLLSLCEHSLHLAFCGGARRRLSAEHLLFVGWLTLFRLFFFLSE